MASTLDWVNAVVSTVGVLLAFALAIAGYRAGPQRRANRLLAGAHETGGITQKDRASLDRLRQKLGLSEIDGRALEAEVTGAGAA